MRIHWAASKIFGADLSDGAEAFEDQTKRIEALMAGGTGRVSAMFGQGFAEGEFAEFGFISGKAHRKSRKQAWSVCSPSMKARSNRRPCGGSVSIGPSWVASLAAWSVPSRTPATSSRFAPCSFRIYSFPSSGLGTSKTSGLPFTVSPAGWWPAIEAW